MLVAGLCGLTGAVAALDGCAGLEVVSRRCVDMRSSKDRRLPSETLGEEACGAGLVTLSAPLRLPRPLVPLELGGSTCRGCDNILEVSTRGLAEGAVLGAGALIDGRDGLEDTLGADGLGLGVEGLDLLSIRLDRDSRLGVPDMEGELRRGAGWAPIEGLGRLTAGGLLRKTGDDGLLLGICGLGADRNERDSLGADIRPNDEPPLGAPRFEKDGDGAAGRLGAGAADRLGADMRAPWPPPRAEDAAWTDGPLSRTSPTAMFITAARELLLLPRATDILHLLLLPGGTFNKPGAHRRHRARPYRSRTTIL